MSTNSIPELSINTPFYLFRSLFLVLDALGIYSGFTLFALSRTLAFLGLLFGYFRIYQPKHL